MGGVNIKSVRKIQAEKRNEREWWHGQFDRAKFSLQDSLIRFPREFDLGEHICQKYRFIFQEKKQLFYRNFATFVLSQIKLTWKTN